MTRSPPWVRRVQKVAAQDTPKCTSEVAVWIAQPADHRPTSRTHSCSFKHSTTAQFWRPLVFQMSVNGTLLGRWVEFGSKMGQKHNPARGRFFEKKCAIGVPLKHERFGVSTRVSKKRAPLAALGGPQAGAPGRSQRYKSQSDFGMYESTCSFFERVLIFFERVLIFLSACSFF